MGWRYRRAVGAFRGLGHGAQAQGHRFQKSATCSADVPGLNFLPIGVSPRLLGCGLKIHTPNMCKTQCPPAKICRIEERSQPIIGILEGPEGNTRLHGVS